MYHCNDCGHTFSRPYTISDDEGDEEYDVCPKCLNDNYHENSNNTTREDSTTASDMEPDSINSKKY